MIVKFDGLFPLNSSQSSARSTANAVSHRKAPNENQAIMTMAAITKIKIAKQMVRQTETRQQICLPFSFFFFRSERGTLSIKLDDIVDVTAALGSSGKLFVVVVVVEI